MNIDLDRLMANSMLSLESENLPQREFLQKEMEELATAMILPEVEKTVVVLKEENAMVMRADEVIPSFKREELLSNAPQVQAGCIVVPKTV